MVSRTDKLKSDVDLIKKKWFSTESYLVFEVILHVTNLTSETETKVHPFFAWDNLKNYTKL